MKQDGGKKSIAVGSLIRFKDTASCGMFNNSSFTLWNISEDLSLHKCGHVEVNELGFLLEQIYLIERVDSFAKVITFKGMIGWVYAGYLEEVK